MHVTALQYVMAIDTFTRCLQRLGREELARARGDDSNNYDYDNSNDDNHHDEDGGGGGGNGSGSSGGDDGDGDGPLIADCLYQLAQCHLALNNYPQAQVGDDPPPHCLIYIPSNKLALFA